MSVCPHTDNPDKCDCPPKGTNNALYNVDTEAAILARDLARLRPRLRILEKNLDDPHHIRNAIKYLDLALEEVSEI